MSTSATPEPTLKSLAAKASELSEALSSYLHNNGIPEPTLAAESPINYPQLPPEMFMVRQMLQDTLSDMLYLTRGPTESIFHQVHTVRRHRSLSFICTRATAKLRDNTN
jgi:hypothetical protein